MLNNVCLQGLIYGDPSFRKTGKGVSFCNFLLAVRRPKSMRSKTENDYIPCIAWGDTAEYISRTFHDGSMVVINGYIQSREYTKNNGDIGRAYEVNISECNLCDKGIENYSNQGGDLVDWKDIPKVNPI